LGGSLITDKTRPKTIRVRVLRRLARELAAFRAAHPHVPVLVGHGSGSFGHWTARDHGWPRGRASRVPRRALLAVAQAAQDLHHAVLEALRAAGLPAWSFPPSGSVLAREGRILTWDTESLEYALREGWTPVVYGDVVLDVALEGVILSTEDLFAALVPRLRPERLLLAGLEPGVWRAWPSREAVWARITPDTWRVARTQTGDAQGADVTGGMAGKVARMVDLVQRHPGLEVRIFSGQVPGALRRALEGDAVGTLIVGGARDARPKAT